jgi:hypothetical protein
LAKNNIDVANKFKKGLLQQMFIWQKNKEEMILFINFIK